MQPRGHFGQQLPRPLVVGQRPFAAQGLDAPHSRRHRLLDGNFEDTDIARALYMRAAAQLLAVEAARGSGIGDRHHAHVLLRVAVAEKRQRPRGQRIIERGSSVATSALERMCSFTCCSISASSAASTAA